MSTKATCEVCGVRFTGEQAKVPGVCARCFEGGMKAAHERFQEAVLEQGLAFALRQVHADLIAVGFTEEAAVDFLVDVMVEAHS